MARVTGIGALMIHADDPAALSRWYASRLGIESALDPEDGCYYGDIEDTGSGKAIHFGIYPASERLGGRGRALMVNYRVDDFDGFLDGLKGQGVEVERVVDDAMGRFAYVRDPEGNPIEIWAEPNGGAREGEER